MTVPAEAGLPPYSTFVEHLKRIGATAGVAAVTIEIQRKIEDIIRPRTGVNTARIAVDMMNVHSGVQNETGRILQMLYSERQMDPQSRLSMSKLSEADATEDERLQRPAGATGGRTTYRSQNIRSTTNTTAPTNDQPPATSSPGAASAAAAATEAMRNATTNLDGARQVTEYERSLLEEITNLYDPTAPHKVSNKDVIWTVEEFPMLNVAAINNSNSGGGQRVNQEFKTAPRTFHE